jgi:hypothetical protein
MGREIYKLCVEVMYLLQVTLVMRLKKVGIYYWFTDVMKIFLFATLPCCFIYQSVVSHHEGTESPAILLISGEVNNL